MHENDYRGVHICIILLLSVHILLFYFIALVVQWVLFSRNFYFPYLCPHPFHHVPGVCAHAS